VQIYDLMQDETAVQALRGVLVEHEKKLAHKPFAEIRALWPKLPDIEASTLTLDDPTVVIGEDLPADDPARAILETVCRAVMPWKKGPFRLFGIEIDAEWRSDYKWDRLAPSLPDQRGKRILDVGCNNGYYLFRLAAQAPAYMLGIDPVPRVHYQYHLLRRFARIPTMEFGMWGWEELRFWPAMFDTIFCMGILYHHRDPLGMLRLLHDSLRPGGLLVMESITVPGSDSTCLFPPDRYARMRNVWFVPTVTAMKHMLARARFHEIEEVATNVHRPEEQRTTPWNPGPSFADFLDPEDPAQTIEGHPAPLRTILLARKKQSAS